MGNDIDDALALDMLYKYIENGQINLLAIPTSKKRKILRRISRYNEYMVWS